MGNNNLTGNIPRSMWLLDLNSLHLRNNHLSGEISLPPQSFTSIGVLDLSENEITGSIPTRMAEWFPYLFVLTLRSNKLDGVIPPEVCHLTSLQVLDLAHNNLSGAIPWCINNFTSMALKKYSSYPISYVFPVTVDNRFQHFDDGYFIDNALLVTKGRKIPLSTQLQSFNASSFISNNLCGLPLTKTCSVDGKTPHVGNEGDSEASVASGA
ncbi:hypothetical protein ACSBR2_000381 [Camellia fascicularis]